MGDLNVKVGNNTNNEVLGKYVLGVQNERGEKWTQWCQANIHQYLVYKQHPRRLWTWKSPGDNIRNQIDYITINKRFRNMVQQSKTYPGADCNSDHVPAICRFQLKLKTVKKNKSSPSPKLNFEMLQNKELKDEYLVTVKNRFPMLQTFNKRKLP